MVVVWLDMQPNSMFGSDKQFAELFDKYLEDQIGADSIYTPSQLKEREVRVHSPFSQ